MTTISDPEDHPAPPDSADLLHERRAAGLLASGGGGADVSSITRATCLDWTNSA